MYAATPFRFARRGATLIEYAVLAGLVTLAVATAIMVAGQRTALNHDAAAKAAVGTMQQQSPLQASDRADGGH
ncbi:MAG: hypothetical protein IT427_01845 [Pirellulales bacterium]|nr:hypothetical protein [Pirellulales bacterium]